MEIIKDGSMIQSLQVGMNIVDIVAKQGKPVKFTDIYEISKITKSNLYKYLNTLTQLGILYKERDGSYTLGSKLIEYGMTAASQENVVERITPFLQELSRRTQNTILFSTWTPNGPMVVKMLNNNQGLNIGAQVGTMLTILSATGKIFFAFKDEAETNIWATAELETLSDQTKKQLFGELKDVRNSGLAFARELVVESVSSVSFPIFNYRKQLLGVVTVVGFSNSIPASENDERSQYLIDFYKELSKNFGYQT
ncbi:helix-turn-helix domain-containing protein [Fodinisporobacter ferrooxydans]|uniref:Helix-turn-helix domain-containing protein n=1 Tax=Fodinisporobacter ferrooxydans TaxID=2901836 RepID=A0ABY4CEC8_9BACL|nr:helix-turn-helix domain-containing protein [Alicyclobacillaceae bacterium MYW30-H2]